MRLTSLNKTHSFCKRYYAPMMSSVFEFRRQLYSLTLNKANWSSSTCGPLLHDIVVKQISSWMTSDFLCLNPSKTEFILIGPRDQLKKIPDPSISLNLDSASTHTFTPTSPVRNRPL